MSIEDAIRISDLIRDEYQVEWELDECTKKKVDYQHQKVLERRFTVSLTYSVKWKEVNNISSRWDKFLLLPNPERHQYALINNVIVTSLLLTIALIILCKARRQRTSPNQDDKDIKVYDDVEDYVGWRLVDRDVFRRPVYGGLLPPLMGTGIQLIIVAFGLLFALYRGWYHPAEPTAFAQWFTGLFLIGSVPGGYSSARVYKVFRGKSWVLNSLLTACIVPTVVLCIIFIVSFFSWSQQSSLAISFTGWMSMISIVIFVLVPCTFFGAYFGEKRERIEYPSRTTQLPRMIPTKRLYQHNFIRAILSGIIPFSAIYLNWHEFLFSMIRGDSSAITVILIFLQLCAEDYHWWWQSFMVGASPAAYMLMLIKILWKSQNLEDFKKKVEEKLEIVELLESSNHLDEEFTEKQIAEQLKEKDNMIASIKQEIVEKQRELERLTQ
ncbi:hypothetical protein CU098_012340 [Rhizopus stolonifer]|uniref:Transmembrane 9 superfamily member n=1 Tax=Rhizopus stolonifer TaxID=4846 RepID=A0A367KXQ2_RHIST|nr:hypothetical protein CU098_012340 [Rhizopus stolonifer]